MSRLTNTVNLAVKLGGFAARVTVGVLWLIEGIVKYRAGFGAADILLVADGSASNSRIPTWFAPLGSFMSTAPDLFGYVIPALEVALGVLLIAGLFVPFAAFASIGTLMLYWGSDQLSTQYPMMVVLSALAIALPLAGSWGVDGWLRGRRSREANNAED